MEELLKDGLLRLIEAVEAAAPELWAIGIKQAYVHGIGFSLAALVAFVAAGVFAYYLYAGYKTYVGRQEDRYHYGWGETLVMLALFTVVLTGLAVTFTVCAAGRFINPEYYAINLLLGLAT